MCVEKMHFKHVVVVKSNICSYCEAAGILRTLILYPMALCIPARQGTLSHWKSDVLRKCFIDAQVPHITLLQKPKLSH